MTLPHDRPPVAIPLRFCATPGCSARVPKGHCPTHRTERRRYDDARYKTERWKQYSQRFRAISPFCARCGKLAQVVDHIHPVKTHPALFWDPSNHRSLCIQCNAEITVR